MAGRSAQEKFDRLHAERVRRVRKRHPRIGGALLAIFDDEQSTQAWAKGAVGERRVGQKLDELRPSGVVALHDLRVPGKRSNIDHIAVAPSGVWVIDAKRYENKEVTRKDVGGLFKHDLRLYVGGRDENKLVEDVLAQADVVRRELGGGWPDVPIRPALCFVDGSWPLFPRPFEVQGVRVLWSKRVAQEVGQPGPLSAEMARHIARRLAESLTPA